MNFKEAFEKYKKNTASEEERRLVEEELEKNELISDYLLDKEDLDFETEAPPNTEDYKTLNNIKKSMRTRSLAIILSTIGILLILVLAFNFIGKPLLNMLYYNPDKHSYSTHDPDISVSLDAYMELHNPTLKYNSSSLTSSGINKYDIRIYSQHYLTNELQILDGKLIKDSLYIENTNAGGNEFYDTIFPGAFIYGRRAIDEFAKDGEEAAKIEKERRENELTEAKAYLSELPNYIDVGAYISFDHYLTLEELTRIPYNEKYTNSIILLWAGVNISNTSEGSYPMIGFNMDLSNSSRNNYDKINEKYKAFDTWNTLEGTSGPISRAYEEHFKDMISFQLDNIDFLNTLTNTGIDYEGYYKGVQSYINENGVKTYGIIVKGTGEAILELLEEPYVIGIHIDDITLSTNLNGY